MWLTLSMALAHPHAKPQPALPARDPGPVELFLGAQAGLGRAAVPDDGRGRLAAGLTWHVSPVFGVELEGSFFPDLGRTGWWTITHMVPHEPFWSARTDAQATAVGRLVFSPFAGELVVAGTAHPFALDLGIGSGVVNTADDLVLLGATEDPRAQSTAVQTHPALAWSIGPRLDLTKRVGVRARVDGLHWIETFEGLNIDRRSLVAAGGMLTVRI